MEENTEKIKILVVEDDLPLTNLIKKNLMRSGFDCEVALNAKDALYMLRSPNNFSILILDYNLPDKNGHRFVLELADMNFFIPYIVITGSGDIKNAVEMMKLGAHDYLIKDLNFITLLPTVVLRVATELSTRKKLAETELALNKSEEQTTIFKSFAEEAGQGFGIMDLQGTFQYMNPAFIKLLKLTVGDYYDNYKFFRFFPEDELQRVKNEILPGVRRNGEWTGELRIIDSENNIIESFQNIFIIKDQGNVPLYYAGIVTDITERKKNEELLKLQSSTLEASANSILITNEKGDIIWTNPAFTKLTGYERHEVYMKNVNIFKSEHHNAEFYKDMWATIKAGKVWRGELINKRKNGELYNEEQTITPVLDDNNNIKNFISIKQDITERKRIEEEIRQINEDLERRIEDRTKALKQANEALFESEKKFRTLFESSGDAIFLIHEREFYDCNMAALELFDISNKDEFYQLSMDDISPEFQPDGSLSSEKIKNIFDEIYKNGSELFEWVFIKPDNTEIYTDNNFSIINLNEKTLIQAVCRDITEKKKAEETLRQTQIQFLEVEKMAALGEMVAGVAHEINTPVGIGITAASHLEEKTKELLELMENAQLKKSDLVAYLNTANTATSSILFNLRRAADLIRSFKQVAVDQTSQELRKFNVADYIQEILLSLRPKLKKTNHIINLNCDSDIEIKNYPGAFSQILTNLIVNSILHGFESTDSGTIDIAIIQSSEFVEIRYSDNGKGIPSKNLSKIFDPFFTTKRAKGGTGLGLHIVYNIVTQKLNGTIKCESDPDNFTTFYIKMPIIN